MAGHLLLRRRPGVPKISERDAKVLIKLVQPLDRTMIIDRLVVAPLTQLRDDALRLAQRIAPPRKQRGGAGRGRCKRRADPAAGPGWGKAGKANVPLGEKDM